ncbi:TPA: hypothetical protein N5O38_004460 [Enterobacter hormaechei subsp. steigerwaltii]|nr:hypothetical protein [Enterobacter hormaechei subsp. steigerwaltii]
MSFSLYSFDAESVNDAEGYTVGVQAIFNNQHPSRMSGSLVLCQPTSSGAFPESYPSLVRSITFQPLIKVPIVLFPLGLLIPFLTELGWVVETFTALVDFHHFAPDSFVFWQFACHALLCARMSRFVWRSRTSMS